MISNNEDISIELDRVVCRLMKLALRTARRRQQSLSNRWMQSKLLDLLNLTEKAVEKKRQLCSEVNTLKAICYDDVEVKAKIDLTRMKGDDTVNELVHKYRHLVCSPVISKEEADASEGSPERIYNDIEDDFINDFLNDNLSMELNFEDIIRSPSLVDIEMKNNAYPQKQYFNAKETPLSRTKAWIDADLNLVPCQNSGHFISSGDTDQSACNIACYKNQKNSKKRKLSSERNTDINSKHHKRSRSKTSHGKRNKSKKNDDPQSKEKTTKIKLKKKSSYNIIVKSSSKNISAPNIGNYFLKAKKSHRSHTFETCTKPISKTLMELCYLDTDKKESVLSVREASTTYIVAANEYCIAETKESLHIDIVTEDNQETIALKRTLGTDAEDNHLVFNELVQDNNQGSMTNIMNVESLCNKADIAHENVHSQTLFLYDINEPSTSKGVRHVSMDAQCGPEVNHKYAMSTTTSLTKMPNIFNTGLRIDNSVADVPGKARNCDFGTCTNENVYPFDTIIPRERFNGIKIKDSETTLTDKIESGTMTQEPDGGHDSLSATETNMLKTIASPFKVEDSGSEVCDSLSSSQRSPLHFMNYAKDANGLQIKLIDSKNDEVDRNFLRKYTRPKLSTGGVYVHSYKERQVSEDVVYQGEWQKHTPVATEKKRTYNVIVNRTIIQNKQKPKQADTKTRTANKENVNSSKIIKPKPAKYQPPKNNNLNAVKRGNNTVQVKKPSKSNVVKSTNGNRSASKVTSKFTARPVLVKKSSHILKKPSMIPSAMKKDTELVPRLRNKSYIPLYLKRRLSKYNCHKVQSESVKEKTVNEKHKMELNADEANGTTLLNYNMLPRDNVHFVVFHNAIENKPDFKCPTDGENQVNADNAIEEGGNESIRRSVSPQSLGSSAGSSPNSIATVRVRPITKSDRRYSSSSNSSNVGFSQIENTPIKTKKGVRKLFKCTKKHQDKEFDNKENLLDTSNAKEYIRNNGTFAKNNKKIFRAQITTEHSQSTDNNVVNRNLKIPSVPSDTGKQSSSGISSRPTNTKQRSPRSRASLSPENITVKQTIPSDTDATPSSQASDTVKNNVIINMVENNLLTEWLNSTQSDDVVNRNLKIPSVPSATGKQSSSGISSRPTNTKQGSPRSRASLSPENKTVKQTVLSDIDTTPSSQASDTGKKNVNIKIVEKNLLTEWLNSTQSANVVNCNLKIPSVPSAAGKQSSSGISSRPTNTKQGSPRSRASLSPENKTVKQTTLSDIDTTPSSQASDTGKENVIINIVENNLLTEWLNSTQSDDVVNRNLKIPSVPSATGKQTSSEISSRSSNTKQCSPRSRASLSPENKTVQQTILSDTDATSSSQASDKGKTQVIINIVENNLLTEWLNSTQSDGVENISDSILNDMRELVEERLDFIEKVSDNTNETDFSTIPASEKCDNIAASDTTSFYDATSLNSSYGTVMGYNDLEYSQIMDLDNSFFDSVVYNGFDPVMGTDSIISIADSKHTVTDLDVLSFNSITAASKMSEYFMAESSPNNAPDAPNFSCVTTTNSVRDIFERKPALTIEGPVGTLASQVFSGWSMDAAPVAGDQPDPVNLVDSETGSVARPRQATSEEVFISGRSTETFESCVLDDADAVVPQWLFQIINLHQSVQEEDEDVDEEEEESDEFSPQLSHPEPMFDVNGNSIEPGMGAGAGAGDGRGIHSDHSQDSSGRGTSLSSSASSSGPHSEAILIDPTAFTTQYDLTREPLGSSSVLVPLLPRMEPAETSHATAPGPRNIRSPVILNSSGDPQIDPAQTASDVDADVSSTDTDVPDSSDN